MAFKYNIVWDMNSHDLTKIAHASQAAQDAPEHRK